MITTASLMHPTKESIERERNQKFSQYQHELAQLREDVRHYNERLPQAIGDLVASRREKLLHDRDLAASLDVPVSRREDAVIPVTVTRKVRIRRPVASPNDRFSPEPELSRKNYEDILTVIGSMGLVMERSPGTFSPMAEEGIRDFFLPQLNALYRGDAMPEVFNASGRTDILIRVGERNVFIAECKVWDGVQAFKKAIDQLLGNMGWRDTKCALLLFVHERSVSEIFEKARAAIQWHGCYKRDTDAAGELEGRYVLHWPGDELRELTLALQVFAVPSTPPGRTRRRPPDAER